MALFSSPGGMKSFTPTGQFLNCTNQKHTQNSCIRSYSNEIGSRLDLPSSILKLLCSCDWHDHVEILMVL